MGFEEFYDTRSDKIQTGQVSRINRIKMDIGARRIQVLFFGLNFWIVINTSSFVANALPEGVTVVEIFEDDEISTNARAPAFRTWEYIRAYYMCMWCQELTLGQAR